MFKVGDKVKFIYENESEYDFNLLKGNTYEVEKVSGNNCVRVKGYNWFVFYDRFEPQYTWTSKFNIGDKVVANDIGIVNNVRDLCISNEGIWYTLNCGVVAPENMLSLYKEPTVKEMTVGEVEKELGYTIKIIKEEV